MPFSTKEANYNAGAGETITGNLARGGNGQFTSAGHSQQVTDHKTQRAGLQATQSQARQSLRDKYKAELAKAPANKKREILQRYSQEARALSDTHRAERRGLSSRQSAERTALEGNRKVNIIQIGQQRQALQDKQRLEQRQLQDTQRAERGKAKNAADRKKLVETQVAQAKALQAKHRQERLDLAAKHDAIRNSTKEVITSEPLMVYKDASGQPRWITISSSGFQDRDGEFTPSYALAADVERADKEGNYGPLLWWHEPKIVLGHCDFNAMHGLCLIESGTFVNKEIGEALSKYSDVLGVSLGFEHNVPRRGEGVSFDWMQKQERSVLPDIVASNQLTKFTVKEGETMDKKKLGILERLLGAQVVKGVLEASETAETAAKEKGLAYKAAGDPPVDPNALAMDPAGAAANEVPDGMDSEGPDDSIMDMTQSDLRSQIHQAVDEALNSLEEKAFKPVLDALAKLTGTATATKEVQDNLFTAIKQVTDSLTAIGKDSADLKATVTALKTRLDTLEGEAPAVATRVPGMGRATSNPATVVKEANQNLLGDLEDVNVDPWKLASAGLTARATQG